MQSMGTLGSIGAGAALLGAMSFAVAVAADWPFRKVHTVEKLARA